jgi:hypothetical protein
MILFYKKETGEIIGTVDGRVHQEKQLDTYISDGTEMGKYVIGWIQKGEEKVACNLDKFEILQKFEDITEESPLDYRINIENGELIRK